MYLLSIITLNTVLQFIQVLYGLGEGGIFIRDNYVKRGCKIKNYLYPTVSLSELYEKLEQRSMDYQKNVDPALPNITVHFRHWCLLAQRSLESLLSDF